MIYKITFSEEVTQEEISFVEVEADSEEEAIDMVENGEYYEINILSADVIDNKDFKIIKVESIE